MRSGKPCFVGTRIAVYDVLDYLASGMTTEQIVADFPELSEQHVRAATSLLRFVNADSVRRVMTGLCGAVPRFR